MAIDVGRPPERVAIEMPTPLTAVADARQALRRVLDPEVGLPIADLGMLPGVTVDRASVRVELALLAERVHCAGRFSDEIAGALADVDGVSTVEVVVREMSPGERDEVAERLAAMKKEQERRFADGTTTVIAIASGKGGVGKSTVAVNLACAFAAEGKRVGLVDLDIWGYSVPQMLGARGTPIGFGELLVPMQAHGVKVVSIGLLVEEGSLVAWRGPMLHETVQQFFSGVLWGELDVLIADLPPGTGDVPMSLAEVARDALVVVVTTPQEVARQVAERAGLMAKRARLRLAGVIENMAGYECPHCGEPSVPLEQGGGDGLARALHLPLLGSIPLSPLLGLSGDEGRPPVIYRPETSASKELVAIASRLDRQASALRRHRLNLNVTPAMVNVRATEEPACMHS